ncbi:MAG: MaoC/PaaZ C-terminal domain-containing protein [Actinomycetota bacterium]|nr:MaoC/PaaZ C-terminal domain-containing protein [Actinomycetota bacterium]MEC9395476.1 MaoC/PaaZ C-terminal domain-containing protein [Actinomycetota bacterium]MED6327422.1 MaoC/PaaZ C-terminal domain-containing protein [Actinomycetota bacterium]MEE2957923.1 MaoC/PaaZ C-terminal domain-containing protein [Actinomycetota bacterium]
MPINPDAAGSVGEPAEISWTSKQSLMYALGVGAGVSDPTGFELEFTTENSDGITQRALPTMGVVIGGARTPDFGSFNPVFLLHAEQQITCHREIPAEGSGIATGRVGNIYDKGKAALVYLETDVVGTNGEALWSTSAGLFLGGEGGWGGDRGPSNDWAAPDRDPDHVVSTATRNDQALLYRLSGDRNPLHSDPTFAAAAGFDTPILHGLCTYGFTGRALLHAACGSDPARFGSLGGRFKSPVVPGEVLDVHAWEVDGETVLFQTRVGDRVVFDAGVMTRRA